VRYLFDRMNASISASGTYQLNWMVSNKAERSFEILLNRIAMRLTLPAAVCGSGVFHTKRVFHLTDSTPVTECK
jgi:hypothetical protein